MSYFLIDDQLFQNLKFVELMRRGAAGDADAWGASLLWLMAGSRIKAGYGDGVLARWDLLSLIPDQDVALRLAQVLVGVGLWHDEHHVCPSGRCDPTPADSWVFHDWRAVHKRSGDEEKAARALQTERNDPRLKAEVWQRDQLPDSPGHALCVYCRREVTREVTKGDLGAEVDHLLPDALGALNLAITHRKCNRSKGNRTPAQAGLTAHLTSAHRAAIEARVASSPSSEVAGRLRSLLDPQRWPLDPDGLLLADTPSSHPTGSAEREQGTGSHPTGYAGPPASACQESPPELVVPSAAASRPLEPPGRQKPAPRCPGRSLPFLGSETAPERHAIEDLHAQVTQGVQALRGAPGALLAALETALGAPLPDDLGVAALAAETGQPLTEEQLTLLAPALTRARAAAHGRTRPRAPALTGARALAWHGMARHGMAGHDMAGHSEDLDGHCLPRRRRRRAKKTKHRQAQEGAAGG
ncbi:Uncharacterized protein conserved in bacteria [Actinomyces bovis]|uniref:Uncharacterized protein conserved in bacteria n=1 Tax=Actinomyces bovis TaxID=1658 RepID=A0ABY1VPE5_9ACTO|nr:Uncharacterized protein conserved in bacteria [Actinomyces bovis]VEG53135.1 Uncharacterized protein conserved in bacteria [Actinomyces israelii]